MTNEVNTHTTDAELNELFTSFEDVHASDELKARTLAAILNTDAHTEDVSSHSAPLVQEPAPVKVVKSARSKWRSIRIAAVAACLTFACIGGVAWAVPVAYMDIETDSGVATLGVNRFGFTVSSNSSSKTMQALLDEAGIQNRTFDDAIDRLMDVAKEHEAGDVDFTVTSGDENLRKHMEEHGLEAAQDRGLVPDKQTQATSPNQSGTQPAASDYGTKEPAPANNTATQNQPQETQPQEQANTQQNSQGQAAPTQPQPEEQGQPQNGNQGQAQPSQDHTARPDNTGQNQSTNQPSQPSQTNQSEGQGQPSGPTDQAGGPGGTQQERPGSPN